MPRRTTRRTTRRTSRRRRYASRIKSAARSPKAKLLGRNTRNIVVGAVLYEASSRLMPKRFGAYQLGANLIGAGLAGQVMGAGQKDMVSVGTKVLVRRIGKDLILPRLGLAAGNGGLTARAQGGL